MQLLPRGLACALLAAATSAPAARADPATDLVQAFSDLCVESRLTVEGLEAAFARVTHGEPPLERIASDRELIFSRQVRLGDADIILQAVAPAGSTSLRSCRVTAEHRSLETVDAQLDRLYPSARRIGPSVDRMTIGGAQLFAITVQWLAPRPEVGLVTATVEVFGGRRKATLTAVPLPP